MPSGRFARPPPCHQHGPGGREQNENTAVSARHAGVSNRTGASTGSRGRVART